MKETLNLGAGNWAVKEDSLLAYNSENGNFKPLPFDFTRASSATVVNKDGLIEIVKIGEPRIDFKDDAKGALLLEPQRTNLALYSEQFDNAYWAKTRCTINQNSIISPSGLLNASLLTATDTSENYIQSNVSTAVSGTKQVISCFVKKGTSDFTHLLLWDSAANGARQWFDLENGIIGTSTSFGSGISVDSASIEEYVNGWYRCIVVFNNSITPVRFRISASNGDGNFNSSIGKTIYIWGYQIEAGSYPTSYIPTVASSVTRNADVTSKTGISSLIGQTEGTLFAEFKLNKVNLPNNHTWIAIKDLSQNNRILIYMLANQTTLRGQIKHSGTAYNLVFGTITDNQNIKIAIAYKSGDSAVYINGSSVATDTNTLTFGTMDILDFNDSGTSLDGEINQAILFKTRLSNAELSTLTTI